MVMVSGKKEQSAGRDVAVQTGIVSLDGVLNVPAHAEGIVLFAHGSGSSRHSPRNRYVASVLTSHGLATLLFDLLTREEEVVDEVTREHRFNIPLLANRLVGATRWVLSNPEIRGLPIGYFGASTGAAAALIAAAELSDSVATVVSRGGRPDLAGESLPAVLAPTLLIVGEWDEPVIAMNREALQRIGCRESKLVIVPGATHLFEEPGTLEEVARIAAEWFGEHMVPSRRKAAATADVHR
jgi:dienelactone hydrolase